MPGRPISELAELLTRALITGDFPLYRSLVAMPLRLVAPEGLAYRLSDETALKADFDAYVDVLRRNGVSDIHRMLLSLEPRENGDLDVEWMTHIYGPGGLLVEPFATRMRVRRSGIGWCIAEIGTPEGHLMWSVDRAAISPDGQFMMKEGRHAED